MKRLTLCIALLTALSATAVWAVPAPRPNAKREAEAPPTYRVKKGDSLYTIGRRTGLSVKELKRLNDLRDNDLKPGQLLVIHRSEKAGGGEHSKKQKSQKASATASIPEKQKRSASKASAPTYKVKKGDSLYTIARRNGLSVKELKRLNGLKKDALKPGQKLVLGKPVALEDPAPAIASPLDPAELLRQEAANPSDQEKSLLGATSSDALEEVAFAYLSTPYRFGGRGGSRGIDCSGFVQQVFRKLDIDLPRTAREQFRLGAKVTQDELKSGDLVFFRTYAKYASHVGIYIGDHKMIHASPRSRRVVITDLDKPYFRKRYLGAKRIALMDGAFDLEKLTNGVEEEQETDLEVDGPSPGPESDVAGN